MKMTSLDRKLARVAKEIEAAKPKGISFKDFEELKFELEKPKPEVRPTWDSFRKPRWTGTDFAKEYLCDFDTAPRKPPQRTPWITESGLPKHCWLDLRRNAVAVKLIPEDTLVRFRCASGEPTGSLRYGKGLETWFEGATHIMIET
jgi:hypothetical protein